MRRGGALRIRASLINDLALTVELDLSHLLSFLDLRMEGCYAAKFHRQKYGAGNIGLVHFRSR